MDITPLVPKDKQIISHYGDGGFVVNGTAHKGNILIMPEQVLAWPVTNIATALPGSFAPLFAGEPPEIVLIGVGASFQPVPENLRAIFRKAGVAVDGMDTGAACRTYTVLLAEGRSVAAALIAV